MALAVLLLGAGCHRREVPAAAAPVRYVVGAPYQMGGVWSYPRESFGYERTGLAERLQARAGVTTDGEVRDPAAMTGAHRTLQLPAIVTVTDLDSGRQVRVRVNDRGPVRPGRVIGLSRAAADLLGLPAEGVARVRVRVDDAASQALRDRLGGAPAGVVAAPVGAVVAEDLAPGGARRVFGAGTAAPAEAPVEALPAQAVQGVPEPGALWVEAGVFSGRRYADAVAARLAGLPVTVEREAGARDARYTVRAGPFTTAAEADAALDRALRAGVTDAEISVR